MPATGRVTRKRLSAVSRSAVILSGAAIILSGSVALWALVIAAGYGLYRLLLLLLDRVLP